MDGWFLKNHIINYFFHVWLQSSNFYLNKPHASMVLIAGSAWLLLKGTVSLMGLSLLSPSLPLLMGLWYERHSFSCYKQSRIVCWTGPCFACSLLWYNPEDNSAAFQKTNTWIQLVSVLNSDMKFQCCSCLCFISLHWLAKTLADIIFFKKFRIILSSECCWEKKMGEGGLMELST